jgi:hypothetical protein
MYQGPRSSDENIDWLPIHFHINHLSLFQMQDAIAEMTSLARGVKRFLLAIKFFKDDVRF